MTAATILLIDDDPKTAVELSRVLAGNGARVLACQLGQASQQIVHRIDAVFEFDIGHDGDTLREVIVRFSRGAGVIVLTGDALTEFDALQCKPVPVRAVTALDTSHPVAIHMSPLEVTQRVA